MTHNEWTHEFDQDADVRRGKDQDAVRRRDRSVAAPGPENAGVWLMPTCDNAGRTAGDLGVPGCWDGDVTQTLRIEYDDHGIDTDIVSVCDSCAEAVRDLASRHGYAVETFFATG